MRKSTFSLVFAVVAIGVVLSAFGALSMSRTITNSGTLSYAPPPPPPPTVQIGVYSDSGCVNALSNIGWGNLSPGATATQTIYVKNEGSVGVTLSMTTGNWNPPSASGNITLAWNRQSYVLSSGSVISAVLTLSISSGISGITTFSFNTTITGTQ